MATTIRSTESGRTVEVELVNENGMDFIADVLGGCGVERDAEADFVVDSDNDLDWWVLWADTEAKIHAAYDEADEETRNRDMGLVNSYGSDMELLQEKECELFGIER